MNLLYYFAHLFVMLSIILTYTKSEFRIIGGQALNIKYSPHTVSIFRNNDYSCVGSLLSMKSVITAAHGLEGAKPEQVVVLAGLTDISETSMECGQQSNAEQILTHRDFSLQPINMDIALIKVDVPFIKGPEVKRIQLCNTRLTPGTQIQVSGWGSVTSSSEDPSPVLQTTFLRIVPKELCAANYKMIGINLTQTLICAGCRGSDACIGDSGAGAIVNGRLCAVVSAGQGCADPRFPGLYTDVTNANVLKFIRDAMKITEEC